MVNERRAVASSSQSVKFKLSNLSYKTRGCVFCSPFFMRSRIVADAVCVVV